MKQKIIITLLILGSFLKNASQNLILNSSFSNIQSNNKNSVKLSDLKDWYVPYYIKLSNRNSQFTNSILYSATEKSLIPKNRSYYHESKNFHAEQLFENNLGFLELNIFTQIHNNQPIIQQKLNNTIERGIYCLKFRYKSLRYKSSYQSPIKVSLDFCFSKTDLSEFYNKKMSVPISMQQVRMQDRINNPFSDENSPWQNACYKITLNGDENYFTFGSLRTDEIGAWGSFFIDDIELIKDSTACFCDSLNKDLTNSYKRNFITNYKYESDSLVAFVPTNLFVGIGIISPDAKLYLNNIISFMQRNKGINIQFIEYSSYNNFPPSFSATFKNYLISYGIEPGRIKSIVEKCIDSTNFYCNPSSEFIKIGFLFY